MQLIDIQTATKPHSLSGSSMRNCLATILSLKVVKGRGQTQAFWAVSVTVFPLHPPAQQSLVSMPIDGNWPHIVRSGRLSRVFMVCVASRLSKSGARSRLGSKLKLRWAHGNIGVHEVVGKIDREPQSLLETRGGPHRNEHIQARILQLSHAKVDGES